MTTLGKFEGRDVASARIKITRAGDGLSKAMAVEPQKLASGAKVYVVLECEVGPITFEPIPDQKAFARVQTLRAGVATIVEPELVKEVLDAQQLKIEEAAGVTRLNFDDPDDEDEDAPDAEGGYE